MFGGGAFKLFRFQGVPVEMDFTALLLIAFFTFPLATDTFPRQFRNWGSGEIWFTAILIGVLIVGSILVHELSHAVVGLLLGAKVQRIRLFIFGGATYFDQKPASQKSDFLISIAGPLSNLALAALFFIGQNITEPRTMVNVVCGYLIFINIGLGIFNLLPGFPMDGGQALRSGIMVLTRRESLAALVVAISGCIVGGFLAAAAARSLLASDFFGAVWTGLIAFWIISGSLKQYQDLPNFQPQSAIGRLVWNLRAGPRPVNAPASDATIRAGQVMSRVEAIYPPETTVSQFLQDSADRRLLDLQDAVVLHGIQLVGLVTRAMALAVPPVEREVVPVLQIVAPPNYFVALSIYDDLSQVVRAMSQYPDRPVTVFEPDGRFAGLITRADLERYVNSNERDRDGSGVGEASASQRPSNPYR